MTIEQKLKEIPSWLSSGFIEQFGEQEYTQTNTKLYQKTLLRKMTDIEILSELKPTKVTISEIVDYLVWSEADKKDLLVFYPKASSGVVGVFWDGGDARWSVVTWHRGGYWWLAGNRILSPATDSFVPDTSDVTLENSDTSDVTLENSDTLPETLVINNVTYKKV